MKTFEWKNYFLVIFGITFFGAVTGIVGCNQSSTPAQPNSVSTQSGLSPEIIAKQVIPCPTDIIDPCGCYGPSTPVECVSSPTPVPTIPPPTPTPCVPLAHNVSVTPYQQSNPAWSFAPMPYYFVETNTIGSVGCFLTCNAMMDGRTPLVMDKVFTAQDLIQSNGHLVYQQAATILAHPLFVNQTVVNALNSDIPSVFGTKGNAYVVGVIYNYDTGTQHYILITGSVLNPNTHECDYSIQDPAGRNFTYLSQYETGFNDLDMLVGYQSVSDTD